jgi:cytochrome c biogenesis factor
MIYLHVDPPSDARLPPDTALVDASFKRLIWLVWLGTALIACGGIVALAQRRARLDGSSKGNGEA